MQIFIRMQTGEGCRLERDGKTLVGAVQRQAIKEFGIKGRFALRGPGGKLNPRQTIARAGGKDPEWVERVWKLEPVVKTAKGRKR